VQDKSCLSILVISADQLEALVVEVTRDQNMSKCDSLTRYSHLCLHD